MVATVAARAAVVGNGHERHSVGLSGGVVRPVRALGVVAACQLRLRVAERQQAGVVGLPGEIGVEAHGGGGAAGGKGNGGGDGGSQHIGNAHDYQTVGRGGGWGFISLAARARVSRDER